MSDKLKARFKAAKQKPKDWQRQLGLIMMVRTHLCCIPQIPQTQICIQKEIIRVMMSYHQNYQGSDQENDQSSGQESVQHSEEVQPLPTMTVNFITN